MRSTADRAKGTSDTAQEKIIKGKWAEISTNQVGTYVRVGGGKVLIKEEKQGRAVSSDAKKEQKLKNETVEEVKNQKAKEKTPNT